MLKNKKAVIFFIIILLLITGGVFYWWIIRKEVPQVETVWEIKDTPEGKIVENKKEGLKVKVPNGWKTEESETVFFSKWGANIFSSDIIFDSHYILEKGCMIEVNIEDSNLNFDLANNRIQGFDNGDKPTLEKHGYEIIKVGQKQAVKELVYDNTEIGLEIDVRIPIQKDKNIYFALRSSAEDKEECIQEFDRFLETVEIE